MNVLGKNNKGFTFVEAIVVAAIIAVLAAIAIPIYNGYIHDARQDSVDNLAETAAAAANTYVRKRGEATLDVNVLNLHYDQAKYSVSISTTNDEVTVTDLNDNTIKKVVKYQ